MLGIFLDTETNGLNPKKHRLLEIAFRIIDLYSGKVVDSYEALVFQPKEIWSLSDLNSLKINGFTWDMVEKGRQEKNIADEVISIMIKHSIGRKNSVFICQNPSFDRIFFSQLIDTDIQESYLWPYHWLDLASMFWSKSMQKANKSKKDFPWELGFSKDLIAFHFDLPKEKTPHRAMNGVDHLITCYGAVVGFPMKKL